MNATRPHKPSSFAMILSILATLMVLLMPAHAQMSGLSDHATHSVSVCTEQGMQQLLLNANDATRAQPPHDLTSKTSAQCAWCVVHLSTLAPPTHYAFTLGAHRDVPAYRGFFAHTPLIELWHAHHPRAPPAVSV